jgi:GWxTD domain-containing protein
MQGVIIFTFIKATKPSKGFRLVEDCTIRAANPTKIKELKMQMQRILVALGIATSLSISVVAQQQSQKTHPELSSQSDSKDVYNKWLNEDVAYIITDEEKRSFNQLKSDEVREQFIEQFWLRRDPMPDTDKNEFREEHYERIAYANQNFAVDGVPGWRTDRGVIYITYGKPDEIQKSESGEIWLFKFKRGTGLFGSRTGQFGGGPWLSGRGPGEAEIVKFEFRNNTLVR